MNDTLTTLDPKAITVNGHNPRGKIDVDGEAFLELKASIERNGILQPILVGPAVDGKHPLIAGERRYTAAKMLNLPLPALVRDLNGEEARAALVENVQREDLSPVEEGRALDRMRKDFGMTQLDAANALGKSERWARERLRLIDLPEKTQAAFDSGAIPLEAVADVQKVAEKAPLVAEAIADFNFARPEELLNAIDETIRDDKTETGCMVGPRRIGPGDLKGIGLDAAVVEDFTKRFKKLKDTHPYMYHPAVALTEGDIDAARAFGALLELEAKDRWGHLDVRMYITDLEWLADRVDERLAEAIEDAKKKRAENKAMTSSSSSAEKRDDSPEAKEKRKEEREQEARERLVKREVNLQLGEISAKALRAPKLTLEEAKLFALLAVGPESREVGNAGLIYCEPEFQKAEEQKNGKLKVTYGTGKPAGEALVKAIEAAETPEEALGLALRAMVLAVQADQEVVAPSSQTPWRKIPGGIYGGKPKAAPMLREIAVARGLDPAEIRKGMERTEREGQLEAEIELLSKVAKCRAKAGLEEEALSDFSDVLLEGALSKHLLKQHVGDEHVASYTITGAGKKRLEKAKAELKGLLAAK